MTTSLSQLETYANDLAAAVKSLTGHVQNPGAGSTPHLAIPSDAPSEIHRARRNVLANAARLQILLAEPADLIQHLASQVRHLSRCDADAEPRLIVWCRINSSRVCNGWASSRC